MNTEKKIKKKKQKKSKKDHQGLKEKKALIKKKRNSYGKVTEGRKAYLALYFILLSFTLLFI